MLAFALAALWAGAPAAAASLRIEAYGPDGRLLDQEALRRVLDPAGTSKTSGLRLFGPDGAALEGRPWWVAGSSDPAWHWDGEAHAAASLPWPLPEDGYSTVRLDGGGAGYEDGRTILLNEEAARWAYGTLQESFKERIGAWKPVYQPSRRALQLLDVAKDAVAKATGAADRRKRAGLFDAALSAVSLAWQQVLVEHGRQTARDETAGPRLRWGLTLDETAADRLKDQAVLADQVADAGADWVRVVFRGPSDDFAFARPDSFTPYDGLLAELARRKIRVMGSVLDSMLWPPGLTPERYGERVKNLATRYKDRVRSWEVASEPNGTWLGGKKPLDDETILLCIQKGVVEVKRVDPGLEALATLHWWDGTAPDGRHGLHDWLVWAVEHGFGAGLDGVGLSVYPNRHPLGLSFEPAFRELRRRFPDKAVFLAGWSFGDTKEPPVYWWLEAGAVESARKDLALLYNAAAAAVVPESLGGGFFWPTLEQMLPDGGQPTSLYRVYRKSLRDLRRAPGAP